MMSRSINVLGRSSQLETQISLAQSRAITRSSRVLSDLHIDESGKHLRAGAGRQALIDQLYRGSRVGPGLV